MRLFTVRSRVSNLREYIHVLQVIADKAAEDGAESPVSWERVLALLQPVADGLDGLDEALSAQQRAA